MFDICNFEEKRMFCGRLYATREFSTAVVFDKKDSEINRKFILFDI